jgi:hypothetical protein
MIGDSLRIHEEFLLLCRNEDGKVIGNSHHSYATATAILAELLLHNRIVLEPGRWKTIVRVTDSRLIGDPLIDEALERIRMAKRPAALNTWIGRIAGTRKLIPRLTERLWLSGLIRREERPFLLWFRRTLFPAAHPAVRQRLNERLRVVIQGDAAVDPRTAVLLACTYGNGLLHHVLERSQLKPRKKRIKAVIEGQQITRELAKALQASVQHYSEG